MGKKNKTRRRLRVAPLILGSYGAYLGFGLAVIGLAEIEEGIGIVRLLVGAGLAGFGLLGIWDGVRDLIRPDKKPEQATASQFILTDTAGNRSSLVTPEVLREQMDILTEREDPGRFDIQILPPLSAREHGLLKQILCIYYGNINLVAFFEMPKDGYRIYLKSMEPEPAVEWLKQLLAGNPDFSEWESIKTTDRPDEEAASQKKDDQQWDEADSDSGETDGESDEAGTGSDEADTPQESVEAFWHQLLAEQKGQTGYWHQLLVIFGESWHDEHSFFPPGMWNWPLKESTRENT